MEINPAGREIYPAPQTRQPREQTMPQGQEISPPAPEIPDCPAEYFDQDKLGDRKAEADPSKKGRKRLLRQMVYMVVCAATVLSLAQTLPEDDCPPIWGGLGGEYISTDMADLDELTVMNLMELGFTPEIWEQIPEEERIAILNSIWVDCGDPCDPPPDYTPGTGNQNDPNMPTPSSFVITYNGTQIPIYGEADPVVQALGEPVTYTEEYECGSEEMVRTYGYGSFYMQAYPTDGVYHIYSIWFVEDGISTPDGLHIGSSQADVEKLYGPMVDSYYYVDKGDCSLLIFLSDGVVTSIQCQGYMPF